jgi:acyl-CoA thioester hydrolase
VALRVNKLGKSSVTWEIGLFEKGVEEIKSVGEIIHVFVDRKTGRPAVNGMNEQLKEGLGKLVVPESKL